MNRNQAVRRAIAGRNRPKAHCSGGGFTLVELLVVLSIMSLLAALLIPAVSHARESARSVVCRSNLTEWGRVMTNYVEQNNGYLPYEDRGEEAMGRICWFDAMNWAGTVTPPPEGLRNCPTVSRGDPNRDESYRMNSKLADSTADSEYYMPYRRLNSLTRPTETVLLFDGDVGGDTISFKGRWRLRNDDVNYRHNLATNFLFTDWHVDNIGRKAVEEKSVNNSPLVWQPADMGKWDPNPQNP